MSGVNFESMYIVNLFGRVVCIDDEATALEGIKRGDWRQATEEEMQERLAEKQAAAVDAGPDVDSVYYQAVVTTADGYGMSRDSIKYNMRQMGINLSEVFTGQKVGLLYNYPYSVISMRTDVRLIYTMFESDKIPDEWIEYLKMADEVLVPSKFCQDAFKRSGIDATIVPLGYNERAFKYIDRKIPVEEGEPFTFIHYDAFNNRKGWMEVFNAFTKEFKENEPVKLIFKTSKLVVNVPIIPQMYPQIEIIKELMTEQGLSDLLGRSNCMAFPSCGEGFGITPLEAMATGIPAIVPNAHGISEYFKSQYMLEVKVGALIKPIYTKTRWKDEDLGHMIECDEKDLRKQMRYAYNHQKEMKELGLAASEYVKNFTYKRTAERLAEIVRKWEEAEVVRRKDAKYLMVERV